MGFSLTVGRATQVFDEAYAEDREADIVAAFGQQVPLGDPGACWSTGDTVIGEMGWSWWSEMQALVEETLGPARAPHTRGVDAWQGVYLDARVEVGAIGRPPSPPPKQPRKPGFISRFLARRRHKEDEVGAIIDSMVTAYAPQEAERSLLQVADLRALREELRSAIVALGHTADDTALEALLATYYGDDLDRCDEDVGLQCLAHTWVATSKALSMNAPLWLVK